MERIRKPPQAARPELRTESGKIFVSLPDAKCNVSINFMCGKYTGKNPERIGKQSKYVLTVNMNLKLDQCALCFVFSSIYCGSKLHPLNKM